MRPYQRAILRPNRYRQRLGTPPTRPRRCDFIDLRDREGIVQVVIDPDTPEAFAAADSSRNEYVLSITGRVRNRPEGTTNDKMISGKIEILAKEIEVLNAAATPPFQIDDENISENVRLTNRVIDLRRPTMQRNLRLRYQVAMGVRRYLDAQGFIDIETPMRPAPLQKAHATTSYQAAFIRANSSLCRNLHNCLNNC